MGKRKGVKRGEQEGKGQKGKRRGGKER